MAQVLGLVSLASELPFDEPVDGGSRPARDSEGFGLVEGETLGSRLLEGLREQRCRVATIPLDEVALAHALAAGEVETRRLAGSGERDVSPLPQPLLLGAEDERALDGQPLACVAGQRVAVAYVSGVEVAPVKHDSVSAIRGDGDRAPAAVDAFDRAASPVADAKAVGVATTDDPIAGSEFAERRLETFGAETPVGLHELPGQRVELGDVAAAEGDHHVAREVVASGVPPVGDQQCPCGKWALGKDESTPAFSEGNVVAPVAAPDRRERTAFVKVVLAAVLGELDRTDPLDDAGEEAAGADRGKLLRVADQDRLMLQRHRDAYVSLVLLA